MICSERPLAFQQHSEVGSFHIAHRVVDEEVTLTPVDQSGYVGVVDIGEQADFAQEALGGHADGELGMEDLEGYFGAVGVQG